MKGSLRASTILIKNARVIDGTGSPGYDADIFIKGDTIEKIGRKLNVKSDRTIDAKGLVACPGFIDAHHHSDAMPLYDQPGLEGFVSQGTTTESLGHCGYSIFPTKEAYAMHAASSPWGALWWAQTVSADKTNNWKSGTEYYNLVEKIGLPLNMVPHIGVGTIAYAAGYHPEKVSQIRKPTAQEKEKMLHLVEQGMKEGAAGLSMSMSYPPDRHVPDDLRIEMLKIAKNYGGNMQIHVEAICGIAGVVHAIQLAKAADIPLHISHNNLDPACTQGYPDSSKVMAEVLQNIDKVRAEGMDITFDVLQYVYIPFLAEALGQFAFPFVLSRYSDNPPKGSETPESYAKNLSSPAFRELVKKEITNCIGLAADYMDSMFKEHLDLNGVFNTGDPHLEGRTVGEIAKEYGVKPFDLFFDIAFGVAPMFPKDAKPHFGLPVQGSEENILAATLHPLAAPGTDVGTSELPDAVTPWPQGYGAMALFFKHCKDAGLCLEDTIKKMTSLPASVYQLDDRGVLKAGMKADIAIIDPKTYGPKATVYDPNAKATGVHYTIVNGTVVWENGKLTKEKPGRVLLKER